MLLACDTYNSVAAGELRQGTYLQKAFMTIGRTSKGRKEVLVSQEDK